MTLFLSRGLGDCSYLNVSVLEGRKRKYDVKLLSLSVTVSLSCVSDLVFTIVGSVAKKD